jgi:Carboxypeptidase regulatory-like domain/TonB-dependent Receptor Plug Domain
VPEPTRLTLGRFSLCILQEYSQSFNRFGKKHVRASYLWKERGFVILNARCAILMKREIGVCLFVFALGFLLVFDMAAFAQTGSASVTGRVFDPNSAVIVEATVTAREVDKGIETTVHTNEEGIYYFANLDPGNYQLLIAKRGFNTIKKPGVTLHIADRVSMNFTMRVGDVNETVTVDGGAPLVGMESAAVSTVVDQTYVKNMPLNGRSLQDLILLTPGVLTQTPQTGSTLGYSGEFSVNGQRPESNYYTVDGVSANIGAATGGTMESGAGPSGSLPAGTAFGTTQALVSVDDLEEFRVESSTYSAEYGRNQSRMTRYRFHARCSRRSKM